MSANFCSILPELLLFSLTCLVLLVELFFKSKKPCFIHWVALASLAIVTIVQLVSWFNFTETHYGWANMVVVDQLSIMLKLLATMSIFVALVYGKDYVQQRQMLNGNLYLLTMFALLGIYIMISANHLLMIYLGLELLTLASYALVSLRRDNPLALEAAMKYFVLGALASGFLLYGMSMLYGATGSLYLLDIKQFIIHAVDKPLIMVFALVFIVAGIGFKLGVVPFHMWVPDVYQGAPTIITQMIGSAPKFGAFAMVVRLLAIGLIGLAVDWQQMLMLLAVASLIIGNLAAIMQNNVKRMLAFSTIAQMAFVLLALLGAGAASSSGDLVLQFKAFGASLYYLVGYVVTAMASFGMLLMLSKQGFESDKLSDFAGLNQRNPLFAAVMCICLFSLAGIPPLLGFYTKLVVLQVLMSSGGELHLVLAVFAVMMSLIAAFYYLRLVKVMYFDKPNNEHIMQGNDLFASCLLLFNGGMVVAFGIFPEPLIKLCQQVMWQFLY